MLWQEHLDASWRSVEERIHGFTLCWATNKDPYSQKANRWRARLGQFLTPNSNRGIREKAFAMYLLNKPRATHHASGYDRSTITCQEVIECCNAENRFNHIHIYLGKYNIRKQINNTKPSQTFYARHNFLSAPPFLDIMNPIHPFFPGLSTPPERK